MCKIDWNLVINAFIAVGTIGVMIIAIWGNWVKYRLVPPLLTIEPSNLRGTVTHFTNGGRVIYYHLLVRNSRSWSVANNCRVVLRAVSKMLPNGDFQNVPLPVQPTFIWAPAQVTPLLIDLSHEQTLDFGSVTEGGNQFVPVLNFFPNNFRGFVEQGSVVRYSLEIVADGLRSRPKVFEVAWNGQWSDNLDDMSQNLTIREIN